MIYLAWVRGLRGAEPQIWYGLQTDGHDKAKEALFLKELTPEECKVGIFELSKLYPFEAKE